MSHRAASADCMAWQRMGGASMPALVFMLVVMLAAIPARAFDPLGFYIGGAVGQGSIEANNLTSPSAVSSLVPTLGDLKANHSAYQLMVGARPIPMFGIEIAYIDLGHSSRALIQSVGTCALPCATAAADVGIKGPAAFAVYYLPIPIVDVYVKAGLSRLQTDVKATVTLTGPTLLCALSAPNCEFTQSNSNSKANFAAGLGAQLKFGPGAVRAEYQRFSTSSGNPGLFDVGLTWTF